MAELKCDICNITLNESDIPLHLKGKRHRKKIEQFERLGRQIPESKLEDQQQDTVNISPKKEQPSAKTSEVVAKNVAQPPKKRPVKERGKRKLVRDEHADPKCTVPSAVVDNTKPFEEQVNDFISQVQQTENERKKINKVLFDVALTFSKVMPGVMPVLYGSQATGLAYRTSDIDVYLCNPQGEENRDFVKLHGRAIHRTRLFTNVILISHARVPVIKAKHIETGVELDISATSSQAVTNSMLLRFLMCYDNRVRKLMMLIGYWAKKCNLIYVNKFSRYSFNLLVIFYLQCLKFRILPPLCELVYGPEWTPWPCYISDNISLLQNRNYYSFHKLFIGFFDYYANFPFSEYVISTYLGKRILASDLEKPYVINSMPAYKKHIALGGEKLAQRIICIQDPLELCHNTSKPVTQKVLKQFELSCKKMIDLKEKFKLDEWLNEMINGEVAKPVLEPRKTQEFSVSFDYETHNDWTQSFKNDLTKTLSLFGITTHTNLPNTSDLKKTKFNSDCLRFCIQASYSPFSNESRRLIQLLKNKTIDFSYFLKSIEASDPPPGVKFHFSAQCFVMSPKKDKIDILFTNEGDPSSFYKTVFNFKSLDCVLDNIRNHQTAFKSNENGSSKDDSFVVDNN